MLHQRAVALLYDELTCPSGDEVRARLTPGGDLTGNLRDGVAKVKVPGEWDSVGGIVPDLILYGTDDTPVRIIEVIVTSPPDDAKRAKLDTLRKRGVDVIEIKVADESDLLGLCWVPRKPVYAAMTSKDNFSINIHENERRRDMYRDQDRKVIELTQALQRCSPSVRREFWNVFDGLGTLDSLYPVRPTNPYWEDLKADK